MILGIWMTTTAALACDSWFFADGFGPAVDGAVAVPVDAVLPVEAFGHGGLIVDLHPVGSDELVPGTFEDAPHAVSEVPLVWFRPDEALLPDTIYEAVFRVDDPSYFYDPDVVIDTATFATGPGPEAALEPPTVVGGVLGQWGGDSYLECVYGNPSERRELALELEVGALGPWSEVVVRGAVDDPLEGTILLTQALEPGTHTLVVVQGRNSGNGPGPETTCVEVGVIGASGAEAFANRFCFAETEPWDSGRFGEGQLIDPELGCRCDSSGGAVGLGWLPLLALLRRRERAGPCPRS